MHIYFTFESKNYDNMIKYGYIRVLQQHIL